MLGAIWDTNVQAVVACLHWLVLLVCVCTLKEHDQTVIS